MKNESGITSEQRSDSKRNPVLKASLGFVFGAILGLILGNMVNSPALVTIFGAFIGLVVGLALDRHSK